MEGHVALLETARSESGLDDFGDDSFREGLERLVVALDREAGLNTAGTRALRGRILLHLTQRLQVEDWYRRHPEIDEGEIAAPLFGVSLPRTGSSALSFLLASDPAVRYLRGWESSQPCPPPATVSGPDPRRGQAGSEADARVARRTHTPSGIDGAMECQDLMALDFKSQIFQAFARVPSYADWLLEADLTSTYAYEKRVLKLLQWREPARPWRLKAPSHLLYLPALDRAFPDARFVMTHRDPTDVILSVCAVYADIQANFADRVDYAWIGELNLNAWSLGMERAIAFRDSGQDARFHDIAFRAMHVDPVGEVRGLYAWLGEPVTEDFALAMARWWQHNDETREPSTRPTFATFGLDPEAVRMRFVGYRARMAEWIGEPSSA